MEQIQQAAGAAEQREGDAADYILQPGDGWLTRKLHGFYVWRRSAKAHPLIGSVFAVALAVGGFALSQGWEWLQRQSFNPDQYLKAIKAQQDTEFAALHASLKNLREGDAGAMREVGAAVRAIESTNQGLVRQLALAQQEYGRLRQVVEDNTGLRGGYDVILTERSGFQLDEETVLGLQDVNSTGVRVNLTSASAGTSSKFLRSGQSVGYRSADGRDCQAVLLSLSGSSDAASFGISCAAATG